MENRELLTPDDSTSTYLAPASDGNPRAINKRNKYTPTACNECKQRKVKCNGGNPCQRCAKISSSCVYTHRGMSMETQSRRTDATIDQVHEKIEKLQAQIEKLIETSASAALPSPVFTGQASSHSPTQHKNPASLTHDSRGGSEFKRKRPGRPQYVGHTSSAFSFGVAKSSLRAMGMDSDAENVDDGMRSDLTTPSRTPRPFERASNSIDTMSFISITEANRLIDVYEEEVGTLYPFLNVDELKLHASRHYTSARPIPGQSVPLSRSSEEERTLEAYDLHLLRMAMAIASVIEGRGHSDLSTRLVDEVQSSIKEWIYMVPAHLRGLQVLTLMSIYQFQRDDEILAWRTIGLAVRAALEMGLHRRDSLLTQFRDQQQQLWVNKLFWCIYVLDRRWSLGVGMPFALHDLDIDPDLPKPANSHPYLTSLIAYGNIGSKVWKAMSGFGSSSPQIKKEKVAYLDFSVLQWHRSLPPELQIQSNGEDVFNGHSRTNNRLRVMLYLRANQMKILIHKRTLLTPTTITDDLASATFVVEVAQDSIQMIDKLNRKTDIYCAQQTAFNYFLVSALGIIFLAMCHAPAHFNQSCRNEFFMALDLIKGFSGTSHAAGRLWRTIKYLKVIGPKLGILSQQELPPAAEDNGTKRTAKPSKANSSFNNNGDTNGASGQTFAENGSRDLDFLVSASFDSSVSSATTYQMGGVQLSYELSNLFESIEPRDTSLPIIQDGAGGPSADYSFNFWTEEDLSRALIDLF